MSAASLPLSVPVRKNVLLFAVSTAVFVEALDIAIINLAIPLVQKDFTLDNSAAQWLQALYVIVYGGLLLVGGKLADNYGRKKVFLTGAALFLVTSLGAGLSPDYDALLVFRGVQGIAAALLMPSALSIITNAFSDEAERSRAVGLFSAFAAIGSGSGLSIGGLIATAFGWKWVFLINVPLIGAVTWLGHRFIPPDADSRRSSPDLFSAGLLTTGILLLSFTVHELVHVADRIATFALAMAGAAICITLFVKRNKDLQYPLIPWKHFRNYHTRQGIGASALLGATFTGYLFLISIVLQSNMGYTAAQAGLILVPFSILSALSSKFAIPLLMRKLQARRTALLGMMLLLAGAIALYVSMNLTYNVILLLLSALLITGTGITVCFPSLMVMSVQDVPEEHHGLATSLVVTCYFLGGGLGLSILSLFMQASTRMVTQVPVLVLGAFAVIGILVLYRKRNLK